MGPFQPSVTFGLGMARAAHGPYINDVGELSDLIGPKLDLAR